MVERVAVAAVAVRTGFGRGGAGLLGAGFAGTPAFAPVTRFDTAGRRTDRAATLPGCPDLAEELTGVVAEVCAGLTAAQRAATPVLLAAHADAANAEVAAAVVAGTGVAGVPRTYTNACVAASTAVADAATVLRTGRAERVVVAAGYLVEPAMFGLFDAGRALARDGRARPFSRGRQGMVLGDGVAAVLLTPNTSSPLATIEGWGRTGDGHHVVKPAPDGGGLARAIGTALERGGVDPAEVGYVNANGTGTEFNDAAEVAALRRVFARAPVPVSSTKSVHGHALEASGLVELVVTVLALGEGRLPVNAGYLGPDPACELDLVLEPRVAAPRYALTLNSAFGGANTALLVGAP
ncbi:beta-ketoacyl synthase N-terminal-like domain-containing protein [Actinokineospora spheciospongiae]|uniref:beta-ketoacyl synthase N-terminal-like domain-containing protein n=1 Tax=Actinokineospora spheciospongiae TaxID=909613 RepID=UPI000D71ABC7|nr:beta-ketoacyl synthase N-terminal-like domain-containing protein [Actinokineospora spheciospongiae]